jgi:hypothetical protein
MGETPMLRFPARHSAAIHQPDLGLQCAHCLCVRGPVRIEALAGNGPAMIGRPDEAGSAEASTAAQANRSLGGVYFALTFVVARVTNV